jgi:hypothetical protein
MTFGGVVAEFKRIGSLVWRGLFGVAFIWLFLTRLADLVIPAARTDWVSYCASQSIPHLQVLVAQVVTVVLSGWMVWVLVDNVRFRSAKEKLEFTGVHFASFFITWGLYRVREKVQAGRLVNHVAENFSGEFWIAVFMLTFCLGMNPVIEFVFRDRKLRAA